LNGKKKPCVDKKELILALDLYKRAWHSGIDNSDPRIKELSGTLNRLPIHTDLLKTEKYRNPNFRRMQPAKKIKQTRIIISIQKQAGPMRLSNNSGRMSVVRISA